MILTIRRAMSGKIRSFAIATGGVALIEFALIVPILMLMTFGTLEIGRAIVVHKRFQRATAMVGDLVARETKVTQQDLNGIIQAANHVMWPYDTAPLKIAIHSIDIQNNNSPNGTVLWAFAHNGKSTSACGGQKALPSTGMVTAGNTGIMVESEYLYKPMLKDLVPGISTERTFTDTVVNAPRDRRSVEIDPKQC